MSVTGNPKKIPKDPLFFKKNSWRVLYYLAQLFTRGFGFVRRCGEVMMSQNLILFARAACISSEEVRLFFVIEITIRHRVM